jgi:DNA-binding CsgD family transcriptional regulator
MVAPRIQFADSTFGAFLHALYSSESQDQVQRTCARFAGDLVPGHAYGWYQFNPGSVEPNIITARGVSDKFLALYESEGRSRDPLFKRVEAGLSTVCSDFDLNAAERRAFRFQAEISSGCVVRAIEAPVMVAGKLIGTLNVAREARDRRFTHGEIDRVTMIARHASLASARLQREAELLTRGTLIEEALDALSLPVIVTDLRGEVVFTNCAAGRLLDNRELALEAALHEAARLLNNGQHVSTTTIARAGMHKAILRGRTDLSEESSGLTARSCRIDRACAIVTLIYKTPDDLARPLSLLSRREREIAEFVVRGLTNVQIASASSISRNTVKRHLKHVFEKLNLGSRAELAAIIAGDTAMTNSGIGVAAYTKFGTET